MKEWLTRWLVFTCNLLNLKTVLPTKTKNFATPKTWLIFIPVSKNLLEKKGTLTDVVLSTQLIILLKSAHYLKMDFQQYPVKFLDTYFR